MKLRTVTLPEIISQLSLGWPELSLFGAVYFEWCHYFIFTVAHCGDKETGGRGVLGYTHWSEPF